MEGRGAVSRHHHSVPLVITMFGMEVFRETESSPECVNHSWFPLISSCLLGVTQLRHQSLASGTSASQRPAAGASQFVQQPHLHRRGCLEALPQIFLDTSPPPTATHNGLVNHRRGVKRLKICRVMCLACSQSVLAPLSGAESTHVVDS